MRQPNVHVQLTFCKNQPLLRQPPLKSYRFLLNERHTVMYMSMKLSSAMQRYSNIERAVQVKDFVDTKVKENSLGRRFTLLLDHRLLTNFCKPAEEVQRHYLLKPEIGG